MAVDAERVRVDARPQALVLGPLESRGQDLVAGQPLLHLPEEDVLEAVALGQRVLQSRRRVGLARPAGHRRAAECRC